MKKVFLSILVPCYNEEANLRAGVLQEMAEYLKDVEFTWEVIISDDESSDESRELVKGFTEKHPGFIFLKNRHGGKAYALHCALDKAKGEVVLTTDMDQSTPLSEIEKLLPWFKKGYEVVIGSRGLRRKGFPWYRQLFITPVFRILRGFFILPGVTDTQCGFKAYKTAVAKRVFPKLEAVLQAKKVRGWRVSAFDVEALFMAKKWGYKVKEVVVNWRDRDRSTTKARDFFGESRNMASEVWRVWLNDRRRKYD